MKKYPLGPAGLIIRSSVPAQPKPLYVVVMTHVEGDRLEAEGSPTCATALQYQTLPLAPPGQLSPESIAVDVAGTDLLREILRNYSDSYGSEPKLFIEPTGECSQTEAGSRSSTRPQARPTASPFRRASGREQARRRARGVTGTETRHERPARARRSP